MYKEKQLNPSTRQESGLSVIVFMGFVIFFLSMLCTLTR